MTDGYVMQLVFASANVFEQVHICLNTYVFTRIKTGQEKNLVWQNEEGSKLGIKYVYKYRLLFGMKFCIVDRIMVILHKKIYPHIHSYILLFCKRFANYW